MSFNEGLLPALEGITIHDATCFFLRSKYRLNLFDLIAVGLNQMYAGTDSPAVISEWLLTWEK